MRAENDLIVVRGSIDLFFVAMVEVDLAFVCAPEITWFQREY